MLMSPRDLSLVTKSLKDFWIDLETSVVFLPTHYTFQQFKEEFAYISLDLSHFFGSYLLFLTGICQDHDRL
jgi:hypothetical protein